MFNLLGEVPQILLTLAKRLGPATPYHTIPYHTATTAKLAKTRMPEAVIDAGSCGEGTLYHSGMDGPNRLAIFSRNRGDPKHVGQLLCGEEETGTQPNSVHPF